MFEISKVKKKKNIKNNQKKKIEFSTEQYKNVSVIEAFTFLIMASKWLMPWLLSLFGYSFYHLATTTNPEPELVLKHVCKK